MEHQVAMREREAAAHFCKQAEATDDIEPMLIAVLVDRLALDVLHHQIGLAESGHAAIEEPCQGGVLERRENLALRLELGHQPWVRQAEVHDLDGDALMERIVGAVRGVHRRHPAAGDQAVDGIAAQP